MFSAQSKPKRKFVSHLAPPAGRDKMKRHDHVVKHGAKDHVIKHGAKDHPAKQYGAEPDAREACLCLIILSGLFEHLLKSCSKICQLI